MICKLFEEKWLSYIKQMSYSILIGLFLEQVRNDSDVQNRADTGGPGYSKRSQSRSR